MFQLGFKALRDLIPDVIGDCVENEQHNPETGMTLQTTTNGQLIWRKADNWTGFTTVSAPGSMVPRDCSSG